MFVIVVALATDWAHFLDQFFFYVFRTTRTVSFRGQTTWNLNGFCPRNGTDCGPKERGLIKAPHITESNILIIYQDPSFFVRGAKLLQCSDSSHNHLLGPQHHTNQPINGGRRRGDGFGTYCVWSVCCRLRLQGGGGCGLGQRGCCLGHPRHPRRQDRRGKALLLERSHSLPVVSTTPPGEWAGVMTTAESTNCN